MSEKPEILFATLAAGGSHVSSANAMAQAIQKHFPDQYETPIREIMVDYGFGDWVAKHKKSWRWQLAHPWTINLGQPLINAFPRTTQWFNRRTFREFARVAAERINEERPKLVVGNHPFMVTALTMSREQFGVGYPVKQAFLRDMSKAEAREALGLSDTFTCLVLSGGEGVGGQIATTTALHTPARSPGEAG